MKRGSPLLGENLIGGLAGVPTGRIPSPPVQGATVLRRVLHFQNPPANHASRTNLLINSFNYLTNLTPAPARPSGPIRTDPR